MVKTSEQFFFLVNLWAAAAIVAHTDVSMMVGLVLAIVYLMMYKGYKDAGK